MMPRQPSVPNLICGAGMLDITRYKGMCPPRWSGRWPAAGRSEGRAPAGRGGGLPQAGRRGGLLHCVLPAGRGGGLPQAGRRGGLLLVGEVACRRQVGGLGSCTVSSPLVGEVACRRQVGGAGSCAPCQPTPRAAPPGAAASAA